MMEWRYSADTETDSRRPSDRMVTKEYEDEE